MKSLPAACILMATLWAAAFEPATAAAPSETSDANPPVVRIVDADGRTVSEASLASAADHWASYARARQAAMQQRIASGTWNHAASDFDVEFAGLQVLVERWRTMGAAATAPGARALLAIADAGFLEEYVLETGLAPGWTLAPEHVARVDMLGYRDWRRANELPEIGAPAYTIAVDGANNPPVPVDAGLSSPDHYAPVSMPCAKSRSGLDAGVTAWRAIAAKLKGSPLEMPVAYEQLALALSRPPGRERGVVFIGGYASTYLYLAGWCAVDRQDWEAADGLLREAVQLSPWKSHPKLELAQVEIMRRRYEDADEIVGDVIATEEDPCMLGGAWRKRGYIRFDQGRFEESRKAYLKSLLYDPNSELALSELALLNEEIAKRGGSAIEWTPPPAEQMTTACMPSRQGNAT